MAGTVVADTLRADSTSTLVLRNGVASTPPTVQDSAGTEIGTFCRAWVNFNGTFASSPFTIANGGIRAAFNVSSVTDNATGNYTVNFTTAMPDANYSTIVGFGDSTNSANPLANLNSTYTTSGVSIFCVTRAAGSLADFDRFSVAIFR